MVKVADAPLEINFPPMRDAEFLDFCQRNKDLCIEQNGTQRGRLIDPEKEKNCIYRADASV